MHVKSAIVTAAATLAVVGGAAMAVTLPAHAETPECGLACVDLYGGVPAELGQASFLIEAYAQGQATGTPIVLSPVTNSDPGEDFTIDNQGPVSELFEAGLVSAGVDQHYGGDTAYELEYSPYGAPTGECAGVAATATSGEHVTLQPCGVSGKTIWIVDSSASITDSFVPLINGSDTNFSDPFVLTFPSGLFPTDTPRPVLYVDNLQQSSEPVPDNQLWSALFGTLSPVAYLSIAQSADITTDATGPSGATVTYPLPAVTDPAATTPPTAVCTPRSGSVFPIGITTVTCTATDSKDPNSPASNSFTITVIGAAGQLADLLQAVNGLPRFGNFIAGTVALAQRELSAGHPTLACQTLGEFITEVRLQVSGSTAAQLISDAERIQAVLGGCGSRPPL
ncbi:MAG TPA: HYR domain-containing protein [Streptosporangiaceae bacterium]|nr:HYR domain-containing protein [Streptosporangiaceae bacterium]